MKRARFWSSALVVGVLTVVQLGAIAALPAGADPIAIGEWTAPFDLQVTGIHSILLPTGRVLMFQRPKLALGSDARVYDPVTGSLADVSFFAARDVFCAGHSLLPDGRIFVTGGHAFKAKLNTGTVENDTFDPITQTWTSTPPLTMARWYPTNTELADGTTLIFGGQIDKNNVSPTVESYTPDASTVVTLPPSATLDIGLYPRMLLLPNGKILMAGPKKLTRLFDPATSSWSDAGNMESGSRGAGTAVLLPGLNKVMVIGGTGLSTTNTAEIIDFSQPSPHWTYTGSMNFPRKHANSVLLPDGTVLEVGGGLSGSYGSPQLASELYDPTAGSWSVMASQTAPRMYHSSALLLPDGRVLSVGQDKSSAYTKTGEIYSPPYLFKGPRPTIAVAPSAVLYNDLFTIETPEAADITKVALIAPGSVTHSTNMTQRYITTPFALNGDGTLTATAPVDGNSAPPGWYMLFLINSAGVPSVASWVHVGPTIEGFDRAPAAHPTTNERSASRVTQVSPDGVTPAGPSIGTFNALVPGGYGHTALWSDPVEPDGTGAFLLTPTQAPDLTTFLLACERGPPG